MKKLLLLATVVMLAAAPARADVLLDPHLSGTGDNVIADTTSTNSALGHLNGQHLDVVRYTGIDTGFIGASSGNDIKISNTVGLSFQVFDPFNTFVIGTTTQVFSLKGTGDVHASVFATDSMGNAEAAQLFDLGTIGTGQSGFTFSTINGELITMITLLDVGGTITDFEHNRIDVSAIALATPLPATVWLFGGGLAGLAALARRKKRPTTQAVA